MPDLANKKITKIFEGKTGEKGRWCNFYVEGIDKRFSMFVFKNKRMPTVGSTIVAMSWEEVENNGYLNCNVKRIELSETPTQSDSSATQQKQSPFWFAMSYMKDLQVARIDAGFIDASVTLDDIGKEVVSAALNVLKQIEKE